MWPQNCTQLIQGEVTAAGRLFVYFLTCVAVEITPVIVTEFETKGEKISIRPKIISHCGGGYAADVRGGYC